ncbi:hypothetical protein BGP75_16215 [Motiliproteus sp. MSK22-1]|nr:hypothetical protein BGP75_16215 [Motiliproteus sp. MSK22-1]
MNIEQKIIKAFGLSSDIVVSDDFIEKNDDLMWLEREIDYLIYVPSYMLWCVRHKEYKGNIVCDRTISALAEFGRCKKSDIAHLNFKDLCNERQKSVVSEFLSWALVHLKLCNEDTIIRSLKYW